MVGFLASTPNQKFVFPFDVDINTGNVGGPSAGMMMALNVYNLLIESDITNGKKIAGTGTIEIDGSVGPVGGVKQKVIAAKRANASLILVPTANYSEASAYSDENTSIVSVDIPLLYEVGLVMRLLFGIKVVVACDEDVQLKRLMDRNKDLTKEQCLERIKSQIPVQKKAKMADIVIWNNGSRDELVLQVEEARSQIISRSHALMGFSLSDAIFYLSAVVSTSCLYEMFKGTAV